MVESLKITSNLRQNHVQPISKHKCLSSTLSSEVDTWRRQFWFEPYSILFWLFTLLRHLEFKEPDVLVSTQNYAPRNVHSAKSGEKLCTPSVYKPNSISTTRIVMDSIVQGLFEPMFFFLFLKKFYAKRTTSESCLTLV